MLGASPQRRHEQGFVVTVELLLVLTILIVGSLVGLIALRNGLFRLAEARHNSTLFVKDSAADTKRLKPFGFDQCEGPRILCKDPETDLSALLSVRRNRLASRDQVYYLMPNCLGMPFLAPPDDPVLPVGYFNALQGRSYGVGAPSAWDWNGVTVAGMCDDPLTELGESTGVDCRVLLYRSVAGASVTTVEVQSTWISFSSTCNEPVVPAEICVNFIAEDDGTGSFFFPRLDLLTAEQVPNDDDTTTAFANLLSVFEHDDFNVMARIDDPVRYTDAPAAGESAPIQTRDSNEGFTTDPDDGPVTFGAPTPEPPAPAMPTPPGPPF